ncbi:hypothetical protein EGH21_21535 [Halomicroarcula sp. F13]|uniref:Halobacterial output domain-containing protein n=1 Tax=Haloarcula rubra TaxID=2487747 RepID=A0AAW4PWQ2_9EURY|nr:HalOD1 output domain-containing protein [Halomicroarcula rubra]MBX0325609.1 hypothetical protein [Halomicroarcula rubra]
MGESDTAVLLQSEQEWSNTEPSIAVVEAIAGLENVEAKDLAPRLFDCADPESLNTLITDNSEIAISFPYEDYRIQIDGNTLSVSYD